MDPDNVSLHLESFPNMNGGDSFADSCANHVASIDQAVDVGEMFQVPPTADSCANHVASIDQSADVGEMFQVPPTAIDLSGSLSSPLVEGSENSIDKAYSVNFGSDDLVSGLDDYTVVTSIDNSVADLESVVERDDALDSCSQDDKLERTVTDHATAFSNLSTSVPPHKPKHFWEDNPFLNAVFGSGNIVDDLFQPSRQKRPVAPLVDLTADDPKDDYPVTKALKRGAKNPLFHSALRKGSEELDTGRRHTYLTSWTSLVLLNVDAFTAFDVVRQNLQGKTVREAVYLTIGECLACKATSTVGKRLGSLQRFAKFCDGLSIEPFPLSDTNMHAYVSSLLVNDNASATSGRSFLESIRFTCAMLGLVSLDPDLVSKRVDGVAQMIMKRAPPVAQADPLTVKQVKQLEAICCNCDAIQDRVIAGGVLLMVYGSARASDVTRAVEMVIDKVPIECREDDSLEPSGYIELKVLGNKGARSATQKRLLLPVVAPMISLSGLEWWEAWFEARAALQLISHGKLGVPLLNRFDADGQVVCHALAASEIGEFIRKALGVETLPRNGVRSHSCKTTILSWMAKYGSPLNLRRNVGHHADITSRSSDIYARDAMAPALREVWKVVSAVQSGAFDPDKTRSGRFRSGRSQSAADGSEAVSPEAEELGVGERYAGDSDGTETDSSSDAGSTESNDIDDSTTLWELLHPDHRPRLVHIPKKFERYEHVKSTFIHLREPKCDRFLCGRLVSRMYRVRDGDVSVECPTCTTCFGSKEIK